MKKSKEAESTQRGIEGQREERPEISSEGMPCATPCEYCKLEQYISAGWRKHLRDEFRKEYFLAIKRFLHLHRDHFPPIEKIFTFTQYFPLEETKVVIIGQDPYHNANQAMGLSFSVPRGVATPPSLRNIYQEIGSDVKGYVMPAHGDLTGWAEQGVLLLNDVLTVMRNQPNSHSHIGWKEFTSRIIELINERCECVVFMLWGQHARKKAEAVNPRRHLVLTSAHPSPFSASRFFGCRHFSRANEYLRRNGREPIRW
jgi:uracil-DNA glycosylase